MKWMYRGILVSACLALWLGLCCFGAQVGEMAACANSRNSISLPCLLQETDIYLWSLVSEQDTAVLQIQNIGEEAISNMVIVLSSYDQQLNFEIEEILPGQKLDIVEKSGERLRENTGVTGIWHIYKGECE